MIEIVTAALLAQLPVPPALRWWEIPPPEAVHRSSYDCGRRRVDLEIRQAQRPVLLGLKVAGQAISTKARDEANAVIQRDLGWLDSWSLVCEGDAVFLHLSGPNRERFPPEYRPRTIALTFLKGRLVSSGSSLD